MNDVTHPVAASPLYEEDGHGWAMAQAALLRALRPEGLDWQHLAEEVAGVGQNHYDALESALRVLLAQLLKWDHQPAFRSRSRVLTIREQHRQFERRLLRNPGLKSALDEIREEAYRQARVQAVAETGLPIETFPVHPPGWNIINNPPVSEDDLPAR